MSLQMIVSSVAPPAAVGSGICFRRSSASYSLRFAAGGLTSASKELSSLSSTFFPVKKDVVGSFKAFEIKLKDRVSVHAVSTKAENYFEPDPVKQDFMSTDALTLKFEDAVFLEPAPSSVAKKSKKEGPVSSSASAAKYSKRGKNPKQLSTSAALIKTPDHFQIFRYPLGTESAIKAMLECNTLVFVVDKRADKKNIKEAAINMFKIRVKKVNTSITPAGTKKAYIMLPPDCKAADVAKRIKIL
ncbi:60S ribosomal protein L23A-like [Salvia miltiorrhiza]|uniref:60S ribosomal protein L23A-like n=1 Tax=Salvia miltiorrhiza TaxID=226208 RepID=UPI0025AC05F2|nr:60S ribosomal protein L23A-like [Salvia miltiorrhiza]XP_057806805.1 60S ribosomal protein L23A-like [Salvia miltiorrhiza]XP_057806806.1 60S ribosomal protein L23A-like [Salvia miltiorrhiza]XP_057806807.1 60S ribosomal protein L23A-like [Salvia miltiorrhiza]